MPRLRSKSKKGLLAEGEIGYGKEGPGDSTKKDFMSGRGNIAYVGIKGH
jgi:hypothetical protein